MNELSLFILDLAQNSIKAHATLLTIIIDEEVVQNKLEIQIIDDGFGMSKDTLLKVEDPFFTTRTTRKVGLGIPLFKELCELCEGSFEIESKLGLGTKLKGVLKYDNVDRPPLGDIVETIYTLMINDDNTDIVYIHKKNKNEFYIDTREIKKILDGVSLKEYSVKMWFKEYMNENLIKINE